MEFAPMMVTGLEILQKNLYDNIHGSGRAVNTKLRVTVC